MTNVQPPHLVLIKFLKVWTFYIKQFLGYGDLLLKISSDKANTLKCSPKDFFCVETASLF